MVDPGVATFAALSTPVLAFGGAVAGQLMTRKGAKELEVRWQREETMRLLRWAAELAADARDPRADLGLAALLELSRSELLQQADRRLVRAVFEVVAREVADDYDGGDA